MEQRTHRCITITLQLHMTPSACVCKNGACEFACLRERTASQSVRKAGRQCRRNPRYISEETCNGHRREDFTIRREDFTITGHHSPPATISKLRKYLDLAGKTRFVLLSLIQSQAGGRRVLLGFVAPRFPSVVSDVDPGSVVYSDFNPFIQLDRRPHYYLNGTCLTSRPR
jgi:hypothetical protein